MTDEHELEQLLRKVMKGRETVFDVFRDVVTDPKTGALIPRANVVLGERAIPPERMESPARRHVFHSLDGFAAYLARYGTEDSVVLADIPGQAVWAVVDEKADRGFETLLLACKIHPLYEPWDNFITGAKTYDHRLAAFVEFLMFNKRQIVHPDPKELVWLMSAVQVSSKTTLYKGKLGPKSSAVNGVVCETTISGQAQADSQLVNLPDEIAVRCPIFVGTEPRNVVIDVALSMEQDTVVVKLSSSDAERQKVEIFEAMVGQLATALPDRVIGLGKPGHGPWEYVR